MSRLASPSRQKGSGGGILVSEEIWGMSILGQMCGECLRGYFDLQAAECGFLSAVSASTAVDTVDPANAILAAGAAVLIGIVAYIKRNRR